MADTEENVSEVTEEKQPKKYKPRYDESKAGVLYLSRIPSYMNVRILRDMMEQYGEVGRLFLQPDEKTQLDKKNRKFGEGWVEFRDKKIAKRVALSLNNTQIGGKRKSKWYEELWNMKYLSRFKWTHLNERLAYEREVHRQRLRTEIMQARKETSFFINNVEKRELQSKIEAKKKKRRREDEENPSGDPKDKDSDEKRFQFKQKDTDEEIVSKKRKLQMKGSKGPKGKKSKGAKTDAGPKRAADNKKFLINLFSGGVKSPQVDNS